MEGNRRTNGGLMRRGGMLVFSLCLSTAWAGQLFLTSGTSSAKQEQETQAAVELPVLSMPDDMTLVQDLVARKAAALTEQMQEQTPYMLEQVLDDLKRSTQSGDEIEKRLRLLAKGAQTHEIDVSRKQMLPYLKDAAKKAKPEGVRTVVNALRTPSSPNDALQSSFWKEGLKTLVPAEKLAQWEKVKEERLRYKQKAIALMTLALVQRSIQLSPEQRVKLLPLLEEAVSAYAKDLMYYEGRGSSVRLATLPFYTLAAEEKQVKEVLSEQQMKGWQKLPNNDVQEMFRYVKQRREQRLKNEKNGGGNEDVDFDF
jgi:hypothetical protein